ncbi:MAG: class I mannose-6-phosphate isomerase [Clostridia bacterium]|nr:class I mannose-6-phosphate isomerase [Clostridia bacterium]
MSFMFHPFPYVDHEAVNVISGRGVTPLKGAIPVAKKIAALLKDDKNVAIDSYPGADVNALVNVLRQQLGSTAVQYVNADTLLKDPDEITDMLKPYLPEDREADPVLLYGRRYKGGYEGLQDAGKVEQLKKTLEKEKAVLVYGRGSLTPVLQGAYDVRVWMDVTPRTAALNFKYGHARNLGAKDDLPYSLLMRRNYYVDFEIGVDVRWNLIKEGKMDYYITADVPDEMQMVSFADLLTLFNELCERPFRCRPVYLEGVWGGFYFTKLRHLPKEMRNCAWIFDMIPMEVSIVAKMGDNEFEAPFFTFIQAMGEKLLGDQAMQQFGGYFPIRFNYDDTYHANGNMSVQCHPDEAYVVKNHDELGRQDESYYVCVTAQGAKTFLGFNEENSCEEFFAAAREAEKTHELIDYEKYINAVPSQPGTQVMIPAGTVHASGRNQVILEIGSLTVGSYTYKLYDYQRIDPQTGLPRPIHLKMGSQVIHGERTKQWVNDNLVNHGGLVRQGDNWKEIIVGEHDLLYFSLRNLIFWDKIEDDTDGLFHVLSLVDGEKVKVVSQEDPSKFYIMNSLDIVVVPASLGKYTIENLGVGSVTVHKTLLKKA